jgi:transcriptional regulator with XRE-family HTH domain
VTRNVLIKRTFDFEPITLGEHIRKKRLMLGMTQKEVAIRLGATDFAVINWETGQNKVSTKYIPALIAFLGYDPTPPTLTTIPERLAAKRRELGWSQKQAAKALGVDPCTWSSWECGGTIMIKAHRRLVAHFLGLPENHLNAAMRKRWNDSHGVPTVNEGSSSLSRSKRRLRQ